VLTGVLELAAYVMCLVRMKRVGRAAAHVTIVAIAVLATAAGCSSHDRSVTDSTAIQREVEQAKAAVALPPGATFRPIALDPGGAYQPGQGTQFIQYQAICAWFGYWLDGMENGEGIEITSARDELARMRAWDSWQSGAAYLDDVVARAQLGDPSGLREMIRNNCR
jgi:hypothetical protein